MKFELEEYLRGITNEQLIAELKRIALKLKRQFLDEVEGYKKYLLEKKKFAERSSYAALESYYEQNLAYAIALDIENVWENNFKEVACSGEFRAQSRLNEYCPGWYLGGLGGRRGECPAFCIL